MQDTHFQGTCGHLALINVLATLGNARDQSEVGLESSRVPAQPSGGL